MNTTEFLIIAGAIVVVLLGAAFIIWRYKKKNKKQPELPPREIVEIFMEAEKRLKEFEGRKSPYQILFELSKEHIERRDYGNNQTNYPTRFQPGRNPNPEANFSEIRAERAGEQPSDIQPMDDRRSSEDAGRDREDKARNKSTWRKLE